ncbi:MAG TPA: FAD-dependent oxidoreductase [Planctomycetota bacterium]|nr:FAD-dependent oxidoreductase [Planctomycetota bacterium]HRU52588.1 FAD-dependent oxidoreductase [Planctomycetota bacterium]
MEYRIQEHPVLEPLLNQPVTFYYQNKPLQARAGEPISSALFANGIHTFGTHHKDHSPQGIFCVNGQCSQCLVLVNQVPVKACITTIQEGMRIEPLHGHSILPEDDTPLKATPVPEEETDVLIVGAGPAGLAAALELAPYKLNIILADDKHQLGGKLSLQTHNFFGSIKECHAGTRGIDIAKKLESEISAYSNISLRLNSPVVGVFVDGKVGMIQQGIYRLIVPKMILITTGAREKNLLFPGCDLPGIYGAGAFQTLVNRDQIKAAQRLFIIGGGNVGLIAAYHALQAGIEVVGLAEALPECGGYLVHLDKIKRLGVPIYTSHSILRANGEEHLQQITIAQINDSFQPIPNTEKYFNVDTLLIAVGLSPVNELLRKAEEYGLPVYAAGDAYEVAEASAAMFNGKITARKMLQDLHIDTQIPEEWNSLANILKSRPGKTHSLDPIPEQLLYPRIYCSQEIPCNPCTQICPKNAIQIPDNQLMNLPKYTQDCIGCGKCLVICPGLAITLVDKRHDDSKQTAQVTIPWEMPHDSVHVQDIVTTVDQQGNELGKATILQIKNAKWQDKRQLLVLQTPYDQADRVAGIRLPNYHPLENKAEPLTNPQQTIVCRCNRVTEQQIRDAIRQGIQDINSLKALLGTCMGPCGGKTCEELIKRIFASEGVLQPTPHIVRPFTQEVPLKAFLGHK